MFAGSSSSSSSGSESDSSSSSGSDSSSSGSDASSSSDSSSKSSEDHSAPRRHRASANEHAHVSRHGTDRYHQQQHGHESQRRMRDVSRRSLERYDDPNSQGNYSRRNDDRYSHDRRNRDGVDGQFARTEPVAPVPSRRIASKISVPNSYQSHSRQDIQADPRKSSREQPALNDRWNGHAELSDGARDRQDSRHRVRSRRHMQDSGSSGDSSHSDDSSESSDHS